MEFRWCKKCDALKPPRTHHCSMCGQCIMRMDHHCPWVGNCVGWNNHKQFTLFLLYVMLGGLGQVILYGTIVFKGYYEPMDKSSQLFIYLGAGWMVLAVMFGVCSLFGFHLWLALTNQTTLEAGFLKARNVFSMNRYHNFVTVFGEAKWAWLLPIHISPRGGSDGFYYPPMEMR